MLLIWSDGYGGGGGDTDNDDGADVSGDYADDSDNDNEGFLCHKTLWNWWCWLTPYLNL